MSESRQNVIPLLLLYYDFGSICISNPKHRHPSIDGITFTLFAFLVLSVSLSICHSHQRKTEQETLPTKEGEEENFSLQDTQKRGQQATINKGQIVVTIFAVALKVNIYVHITSKLPQLFSLQLSHARPWGTQEEAVRQNHIQTSLACFHPL